jgi:GNAT superfamily N-acetyltransferase
MVEPLIRSGTANDAMAVVLLREAVAAEDRWIGEASPNQRDAVLARIVAAIDDPDRACFVVEQAGEVTGSLVISQASGVADLGMFLAPEARGQGLGRRLLDTSVDWARSVGCHKVVPGRRLRPRPWRRPDLQRA